MFMRKGTVVSPLKLLSNQKQVRLKELIQQIGNDLPFNRHPLQSKYIAVRFSLFDKDYSVKQVNSDLVSIMVILGRVIKNSASETSQADACLSHMVLLQALIELFSDCDESMN